MYNLEPDFIINDVVFARVGNAHWKKNIEDLTYTEISKKEFYIMEEAYTKLEELNASKSYKFKSVLEEIIGDALSDNCTALNVNLKNAPSDLVDKATNYAVNISLATLLNTDESEEKFNHYLVFKFNDDTVLNIKFGEVMVQPVVDFK
jgi:hypothetical protein